MFDESKVLRSFLYYEIAISLKEKEKKKDYDTYRKIPFLTILSLSWNKKLSLSVIERNWKTKYTNLTHDYKYHLYSLCSIMGSISLVLCSYSFYNLMLSIYPVPLLDY